MGRGSSSSSTSGFEAAAFLALCNRHTTIANATKRINNRDARQPMTILRRVSCSANWKEKIKGKEFRSQLREMKTWITVLEASSYKHGSLLASFPLISYPDLPRSRQSES